MKSIKLTLNLILVPLLIMLMAKGAMALVSVQCPGDTNGDAIVDVPDPDRNVTCMHLSSGDGYVTMADGTALYIFGFANMTGIPDSQVMAAGMVGANFPAPSIKVKEGDEFYLTLTNVGMKIRPDLFDPHTVHYHGFPNSSSIFDGIPENSVAVNMGASLTYYYYNVAPGTYMYHCHVEATEHMQMGMLGSLYVTASQDDLPDGTVLGTHTHNALTDKYAYDDEDGTTLYNVDFPIQIGSFDSAFHNASESVQPLPFALMKDDYFMLNGRGYPDTVDPNPLPPPQRIEGGVPVDLNGGKFSQNVSSLISVTQGQKILLRISNLNVTEFNTLTTLGLTMKVVGKDAAQLRDANGNNDYYETSSVSVGGGESFDVIIDTAGVPTGTYFMYSTNLNYLSNSAEDNGGMMTEIVIN